ncbi:MAG: ATP-binding protein [Arcobacteraceae bacterium]
MFLVGKPVLEDHFFDRTKMKTQVKNFLNTKQDFMIKAPRRYGKTSLIKEVLKDTQYIYIDIRRVSNIALIPNEILEKAFEIAGIHSIIKQVKKNVLEFLANIKSNISINLGVIEATAQYLSREQKNSPCEDLVFALNTVNDIAISMNKPMTIVFDEFQDIKKFKCDDNDILEVLRGSLQHLESVHSIFLGSIETIMSDIFENKKSPFFNYCRKLKLDSFDLDELSTELIKTFNEKDIKFDDEKNFIQLLQKLKGHPANTMVVMQNLYYQSLEKEIKIMSKGDLEQAYENGYFEMIDLVEQYIIEIKDKKHYHDVLYKMVNNQKQTLIPQALHQVRSGLMNIGYLQKDKNGEYQIIDNFLYEYLDENGIK